MRAPSLLSQCLTGFITQEKTGSRISIVSERDSHFPSPAVEVVPSKIAHPDKYAGENVDLQGISVFKGRVSVADIIGFSSSETLYSKNDGYLKSWESSIDLVNILKHEIRDGQLSFRGKRVLELSCGYALPGTFTCMKGATTVHFQDLSAETVRRVTIPNVLANLEQERDRLSHQPESPFTPSRQQLSPEVRFYAGDWSELHAVLSVVRADSSDAAIRLSRLSSSEEDLMDGCSSQDGSVAGNDTAGRRSRKLSGSRAWERASELDTGDGGGYDIILIAEIPYSAASLKKLYRLITKCLRPPYGVVYLAAKKNFVGSKLRSLMDEEGLLGSHLLTELSHSDREMWKIFFLK